MYEAKYQKYITKSEARFAEPDEILSTTKWHLQVGTENLHLVYLF